MLGAIVGDVAGSVYEHRPVKTTNIEWFPPGSRFTDDSVLTVAVAEAILDDGDFQSALRSWGRRYPNAGYGASFHGWLRSDDPQPYNSWGNGSAMRVSPVGFAFNDEDKVLEQAGRSASVTHDHSEGIKGAQATALSIFLARNGQDKAHIKHRISDQFDFNLDRRLDDIRPDYHFDVSCQGSVPEAIIAFLESTDYNSAISNAISLGGDADTQACIAGSIAEAFYGSVPDSMKSQVLNLLPPDMIEVLSRFRARFMV